MSDYFEFDSYAVLADIKNCNQPQPNRNHKRAIDPCDTTKTATTALTATVLRDTALLLQPEGEQDIFLNTNISNYHTDGHVGIAEKQSLKWKPAVVAVSAVPQAGWQNLEKSNCGSVEEVAVFSEQSATSTIADTALFNLQLINFNAEVRKVTTLDKLLLLLEDFAGHKWTLLERSAMSNSYTPIAKRLIEAEQADKFRTLENLAELCWRPL